MIRLLPITAVLLATLAPAASGASDICAVLHDPISDVHPAWMPPWPGIGHRADAIDLTGVQMSSDGESLIAIMGVRDLGAASGPGAEGATFTVDWDAGDRHVTARATRSADAWSFDWDDSLGAHGDAGGSVSGNTIRIEVPLGIATQGSSGALERIHAMSTEDATRVRAATAVDEAPNFYGGPRRYAPGAACATPMSGMGEMCTVLAADPSNAAAVPSATDLRSVSFGAGESDLVVQIEVGDLGAATAGSGERWEVRWFNPLLYEGSEDQIAFAERLGEQVDFGYARGGEVVSTTGRLDASTDRISIVVPREHLVLMEGTRLTQVRASAWVMNGTSGAQLPAGPEAGSWIVGKSCSQAQVQACPIVLDRKGDARYAEATDEVPENYAGLDLRSVGASTSTESVTVRARVENLRAPDPPGAEVVGWTLSWIDGDRRIFAQAERYPEGLVFRYGARRAHGTDPMGPGFTDTIATTGRVNVAGNLIEIDVPRSLMPEDGLNVSSLGATAWALASRNTASVYLVWDETVGRDYLAGAACAA